MKGSCKVFKGTTIMYALNIINFKEEDENFQREGREFRQRKSLYAIMKEILPLLHT